MVAYAFKTSCLTKTLHKNSSSNKPKVSTHFLISEGTNKHMKKIEGTSINSKNGFLVNKKEVHKSNRGMIQTHDRYKLNEKSVLKLLTGKNNNLNKTQKMKEKNKKSIKKILNVVETKKKAAIKPLKKVKSKKTVKKVKDGKKSKVVQPSSKK